MTEITVPVGQAQDQEWVPIGTELGAISVESMKDCHTTTEERETEQIQQMFNLDEEQTSFKH